MNTPVTSHGYWWLTSRKLIVDIKNRIAFKICTAVPRVEKYKIGAAVQILRHYPLYYISRRLICERSVKYATIHVQEVSHQYP